MPNYIDVGDGSVIVAPPRSEPPPVAPATPPPAVAVAPTPEYIASIDAQVAPAIATATALLGGAGVEGVTFTPSPPTTTTGGTTTTPEQIAAAEAAARYTEAALNALLAGGSTDDIVAAAVAAGAPDDVARALADADLGVAAGINVESTDTSTWPIDESGFPDVQEWGHDDQGTYEAYDYAPDLDGFETLSVSVLRGQAFVDYVKAGCLRRGLDTLAVFANGLNEGMNGGIGDKGTSYGPWQLHDQGALPKVYWGKGKNNLGINTWAWSKNGIDYALDGMASTSAKGKFGASAVHDLVYYFEKPTDKPGAYVARLATYTALQNMSMKVWDYLASKAIGPHGTAAPPAENTAPPASAVRNLGTWRDFIAILRDDTPAAGTHMQNTARRLRSAVT